MNLKAGARPDTPDEAMEVEQRQAPDPAEQVDLEPLLEVGTSATFQFEDTENRGATRYTTTIRGWYKDRYIFLDRPTSVNFDIKSRVNVAYIVRFIHDGSVVGFLANLRDEYKTSSFPFFRCDWPRQVQSLPMRKHERVDVRLDCEVKLGSGDVWQATILNMSSGGCNILCPKPPLLKDLVHITFTTQSGVTFTELPTIVRNNTEADGKFSVGCQFRDQNDDLENTIELFVACHHSDTREDKPEKTPVLIMELGTGNCRPLRDALFMSGCETLVAHSVMEGLSCMRDLKPGAVLIAHQDGRVGENEVCALLKETHGMVDTPVYVYNISEEELGKEGKQDNVRAYFKPESSHDEISMAVRKAIYGENP